MSSDDENDSGVEQEVTLASIARNRTINLRVSSGYTQWGPVEAFRELFKVIRKERTIDGKTHILYTVPNPKVATDCLGYIRFARFDDQEGFVEVTNRKAVLQPGHLDFGSSSKRNENTQAGTHGEGLKLALLVLLRGHQNHAIRCTTGNVRWNFNFSNLKNLVARLGKMTYAQIDAEQKASQVLRKDGVIPFAPSASDDVQFLIGWSTRKGRDDKGILRTRDRVHINDFEEWCKSAIFLQFMRNEDIVRTTAGDLIYNNLLPRSGNLYLKGLLLKESTGVDSASMTGKPLKFGYNFRDGVTNRERKHIQGRNAESQAILRIWDQVLILKPEFVIHIHEMLLASDSRNSEIPSSETVYADVANPSLFQKETVTCLKNHLFSGGKKWYYSAHEKAQNHELPKIIHGLGREGVQIPNAYWSILEMFKFVRTAAQEEERRFLEAQMAVVPNTAFAQETYRLIRASLRGCTETHDMGVRFVQAGPLALDICLSGTSGPVKIHSRWLTKAESTKEIGVTSTLLERNVLFHTISRLFSEVLREVCAGKSGQAEKEKRERIGAQQRLLEYLEMKKHLSLGTSSTANRQLSLKWDDKSSWGDGGGVSVQLHREATCSHLRQYAFASECKFHLLTQHLQIINIRPVHESTVRCIASAQPPNSSGTGGNTAQGCLSLTLSLSAGSYDFEPLKTREPYFAVMLKPSEPNSVVLVSNVHTATGAQRGSGVFGHAPRKSYSTLFLKTTKSAYQF
ncbi:hypothetical protein BGZ61DRAFT_353878 [Ilyonectria robusta]|uniref:uncharacterized protein n=1 Tax=Ilyonectria robusta TaxID=1079257 RepID=UPI001E8E5ACB|nr:uncharacterized protein BGZ61DRAFT_353878 [Ilyonectria robusta]KAH8688423.1 hypothetical protein BGZ61DRAFT_353878 [Ilyonectria robusta]